VGLLQTRHSSTAIGVGQWDSIASNVTSVFFTA